MLFVFTFNPSLKIVFGSNLGMAIFSCQHNSSRDNFSEMVRINNTS